MPEPETSALMEVCPYCGSPCSQILMCRLCGGEKGVECCMPAGVGCPCLLCEEWENREEENPDA